MPHPAVPIMGGGRGLMQQGVVPQVSRSYHVAHAHTHTHTHTEREFTEFFAAYFAVPRSNFKLVTLFSYPLHLPFPPPFTPSTQTLPYPTTTHTHTHTHNTPPLQPYMTAPVMQTYPVSGNVQSSWQPYLIQPSVSQ